MIRDNKSNQCLLDMSYKRSHKYSIHNNNIKYINSIIKLFYHYAIKLDVVSIFMIFNDFNFIFL